MGPPQPMGGGEAPMDPAQAGLMSPPVDPMNAQGLGEVAQPTDPYEQDSQDWVDFALQEANLAKNIRKKKDGEDILNKMGQEVARGYEEDERSRAEWMKNNKEWIKLALLIRETKTFPWPKASNVKFPLVATAAMQFSARAYPSLVPSDGKIVKGKVSQNHPNSALYDAAKRVGHHMSFQVMNKMPRWQEDMDKLLMTLAVSGLCFKKTFYDSCTKENRSYLVYPENLCVNYYAKDLESAYRKTEIIPFNKNQVLEKVLNDEEFLDVLKEEAGFIDEQLKQPVASKTEQPSADNSTPHIFLAQSTYWDLDGDGYEEPYVITVHKASRKVVRITARWDSDGVYKNEKNEIYKITPVEYFTDFSFIPNPDGSIYALGFGALLGPMNVSVNTLLNLLIDAGVINNLQSGFIGKGLRIKMGEQSLAPGQWKVVNATGDDLSKSIFPLPSKEPSSVLFQLMNLLITSGNQLASIAEIMVGKMPGQNTPAGTTQTAVEQSMAVFTAIYKRVYRSLDSEFKKMFRLNGLNPEMVAEETKLAGIPLQASDYDFESWMITPGADPSGEGFAVRMNKMQQVGQLLQFGHINVGAYSQMMLELLEIPDGEKLIQQPQPPPPDPKAQLAEQQMKLKEQEAQLDSQAKQQDMDIKERLAQLDAQVKILNLDYKERESALKLKSVEQKGTIDIVKEAKKSQFEEQKHGSNQMQEALKAARDRLKDEQIHRQKMRMNQESHQQKLQQAKTAKKPS